MPMVDFILDCPILILELPKEKQMVLELQDSEPFFELEISEMSFLPYYTGDYEVTPRVWEQQLDTINHSMSDNVIVHEIPKAEVSNIYGTTVTIG